MMAACIPSAGAVVIPTYAHADTQYHPVGHLIDEGHTKGLPNNSAFNRKVQSQEKMLL